MKKVLDVCCGSRMFWFDTNDARALFCDKRSVALKIKRIAKKEEISIAKLGGKILSDALKNYNSLLQ